MAFFLGRTTAGLPAADCPLPSVALRYHHPLVRLAGVNRLQGWHWSLAEGEVLAEPAEPSPRGPHARGEAMARLEAVLFLSREPLASRRLAQLAGLADGTEARTLVRLLNRLYDSEGSAFRVEEVAGGFQLMTRAKFAPWLRRLHAQTVEVRLSSPALETLAVLAYRQPVVRAEIEAIRGVQCGEILRQLMERDLVRIAGRSDDLGRPFLYATTRYFLQVFGLRHLEDLPPVEVFAVDRTDEAQDSTSLADGSDKDMSINYTDPTRATPEETNVKAPLVPMDFPTTLLDEEQLLPTVEQQAEDDEEIFDDEDEELDDDEEDLDDEEDDEGLEDAEWEEVDDEEEDEEEEEDDEDEDWDEDEEDWDEDEDEEDWDEDEDEDEEFEEE